jgi:hypothetical protein
LPSDPSPCSLERSLFLLAFAQPGAIPTNVAAHVPNPNAVVQVLSILYGFPLDLTEEDLYSRFEARYNKAIEAEQEDPILVQLILEGFEPSGDQSHFVSERERRRQAAESYCHCRGMNFLELELLSHELIARFETRWLRQPVVDFPDRSA